LTGPAAGRTLAIERLVRGCGMECVDVAMISSPYLHGLASVGGTAQRTRSSLTLRAHPRDVTIVRPAGTNVRLCAHSRARVMPASRPRVPAGALVPLPHEAPGTSALTCVAHATHASRGPYTGTSLNLRATSHSELPLLRCRHLLCAFLCSPTNVHIGIMR
jgi:hypothetical protein